MPFTIFRRSSFLLGMLILILCHACSNDDLTENNLNDLILTEEDLTENEILELVNAHRQSIGKYTLIISDRASELAHEHTYYMIDQESISHDNFNERASILFEEESASGVGENVAAGYPTAQGVMNGWLNSTGHRSNIEGDYTHIGISAIKSSAGTYYYTQLFLKK